MIHPTIPMARIHKEGIARCSLRATPPALLAGIHKEGIASNGTWETGKWYYVTESIKKELRDHDPNALKVPRVAPNP